MIARERSEFRQPVRVHFHQAHVVVYINDREDILILKILDGRQEWERLL
jgi:toxin ParE1/3/4